MASVGRWAALTSFCVPAVNPEPGGVGVGAEGMLTGGVLAPLPPGWPTGGGGGGGGDCGGGCVGAVGKYWYTPGARPGICTSLGPGVGV